MRKIRRFLRNIILFFLISTIGTVVAYRWIPVYITPLMLIRVVGQIGNNETIKLRHRWVPKEKIANNLAVAVIASEDQMFELHHGIDIESIKDAWNERTSGGRKRGASTISQQTAKNVFLWPSSTWLRKGLELYFTCLIEIIWDKERIMEVYLNSIEMGDGIYGAQAVANINFKCDASSLSRQQCALIAATLPNPLRFNSAKPSAYMIKRQGQILVQMRNVGSFPMTEKEKEQRIEYLKKHSRKRK